MNKHPINAYIQLQLQLDPITSYNECILSLIDFSYNYRIKDGIESILKSHGNLGYITDEIDKLFKSDNQLIEDKTRKLLMKNFIPTNTSMLNIIKLLDLELVTYCLDKGGQITRECLDLMISNVIYYSTFKSLITNFLHIVHIDIAFLEQLCSLACSNLSPLIEKIINLGINPTTVCLERRLWYTDFTSFEILLKTNVLPNNKCLALACFYHKFELAKMILNCKIIPDKASFWSIYANQELCTDYYRNPNFTTDSNNIKYYEQQIKFKDELTEFAELFFKFGYCLTYEDLLHLMDMKITVDNYGSRFGIVLDEKYVEKAWLQNYFPYECTIKPTLNILYKLCENPTTTVTNGWSHPENKLDKRILKILKQSKEMKPDTKVLEILCKDKENISLVKKLMSKYDLKTTYECLKNIIVACEEKFMLFVLEKYNENKKLVEEIENIDEVVTPIPQFICNNQQIFC